MPAPALTRLFTYVANTLIQSAQVNAEHDQFIGRLNLVGRVLNSQFADVGTNADTNEKVLHTYTVDAGRLANNGDSLTYEFLITTANNANGKQIRIKFAGITIEAPGIRTNAAERYYGKIIIYRVTATTARAELGLITSTFNYFPAAGYADFAATFANALVLEITGQNSVAAANDIVQRTSRVIYFGA